MANRNTKGYLPLVGPIDNVSFDHEAIDDLLRSHGVEVVHYRAIKCPIGLVDQFSTRGHADHGDCSNGFLYKKAGEATILFRQNSSSESVGNFASLAQASVQASFPRFYDDCPSASIDEEIVLHKYDRIYLKNPVGYTVITHLFQANNTGVERMAYPVMCVEDLIDSTGKEYTVNQDFNIVNGNLVWVANKQPPSDSDTGKGPVLSIRYRYVPYWYVESLAHEIRISRKMDAVKGIPVLYRMPQQVNLVREHIYHNVQSVEESSRNIALPSSGGFGPR
jgi:hypothetical protein